MSSLDGRLVLRRKRMNVKIKILSVHNLGHLQKPKGSTGTLSSPYIIKLEYKGVEVDRPPVVLEAESLDILEKKFSKESEDGVIDDTHNQMNIMIKNEDFCLLAFSPPFFL